MNKQIKVFFIAILILFSYCSQANKSRKSDLLNSSKNNKPFNTFKDLETIKKDGVLHAITIYSSTSYFSYKGMPMGFEYELLSRLAKELGLRLKIKVAESINDLFEMLNNGDADLIAFGLTITEPRKKLVRFTKNQYVTHQTLV